MLFYFLVLLPAAVLGRQPENFVVGGSDAADGAWPWQMSLRGIGGGHSCGASLIGGQKAVCAAHCVGNGPSTYTVIVGTNLRSCPNDDCTSRRLTGADRHPDFIDNGNVGYPNDISILTWLAPVAPAPGKIQFINLATSTNQIGLNCFITGWGRTSATSPLPENLQEAKIDILTTAECQGYWSETTVNEVNHVCIFDKTNQALGACNGDSGGPLVCQTTGPLGRWELVGATSWGRTGCSTAFPSVYTRISSYVDWINAN